MRTGSNIPIRGPLASEAVVRSQSGAVFVTPKPGVEVTQQAYRVLSPSGIF